MERLSLVIASHNRGSKIGPTLISAQQQTRPPDEILVLNDGGSAPSRTYISEHFPAVRVIDGAGGSPAAARNLGAAHARHSLVMFLDDDDLLHPQAVETLLRTLRAFPEARAAYADHTFFDRGTGFYVPDHHCSVPAFDRLNAVRPAGVSDDVRLFDRRLYYPMLTGGLLQQPWLVERDYFLAQGGFDQTFSCNEDWELYLRIVRQVPVALTNAVISDHVVEPGRAHTSRSTELDSTGVAIIRKHLRMAWRDLDLRAVFILQRRLANHNKTAGDRVAHKNLRAAWRSYLLSFVAWPFDHVVVARLFVLWPLQLIRAWLG